MTVEENTRIKAKLLYKFLKRKGLLQEFIVNCKKRYSYYVNCCVYDILCLCHGDISCGFNWAHSEEGFLFWEKVYKESIKYINENITFYKLIHKLAK